MRYLLLIGTDTILFEPLERLRSDGRLTFHLKSFTVHFIESRLVPSGILLVESAITRSTFSNSPIVLGVLAVWFVVSENSLRRVIKLAK